MLSSYASGHSMHVRVRQALRLRGTPRGGIRGCILKQYTATLSNDGAKVLLFDCLIKYYEMKYITQYSTRNKIWNDVIFLMHT